MKRIPESKRGTLKGRRSGVRFVMLPAYVLDSPQWWRLSGSAAKLLIDLMRQFVGTNNGLLCPAGLIKDRRWNSQQKITRAVREAEDAKFLLLTKQGGMRMGANYYAVTWLPIDECQGRIDYPPEKVASHLWRKTDHTRNGCYAAPETGANEDFEKAA